MNNDERKVIEDTVAHWEKMIAWADKQGEMWQRSAGEFGLNQNVTDMYEAIGEIPGSLHCPLCQTYKRCTDCPLSKKFGSCNDGAGNLYRDTSMERHRSWSQWTKAARTFLEQIKGLLQIEIDWTKPIRFVNGIESGILRDDLRVVERHELGNTLRTVCYVDKYGRNGVNERIIENVPEEPEYKPLHVGDRLTIRDREYIVVRVAGRWSFIDMLSGNNWSSPINPSEEYGGANRLSLDDFKILLCGKTDQWPEIYKTVRRRQG